MSQSEFGELAYEVMRLVFAVRDEMGRYFDEKIYKREIASRVPGMHLEVPVTVSYLTFEKQYYLDSVVNTGGLFEFKTVESLTPKHEAQLLNYLHLTGLGHGKLVNLRTEPIGQKFVNTSIVHNDRINFVIDRSEWIRKLQVNADFSDIIIGLLRDWGTGLDLSLYEEAIVYFFGGDEKVLKEIEVRYMDKLLGCQKMRVISPGVTFKVTALPDDACEHFVSHAARLLKHTSLNSILWVNIGRKTLSLKTIEKCNLN